MEQSNKELFKHFIIKRLEDCAVYNNCFTDNTIQSRSNYIILLINEGKGKQIIDFHEFELIPGRVFFISTGQVHQFKTESVTGFHLAFDLDFYHSVKSIFKLYDFPFFHTSLTSPYLDSGAQYEVLKRIADDIFHEFHSSETFGKWSILRAGIENLLIQLTRIRQKQMSEHSDILIPNNEKLRKLELLIERNYKEYKEISFYADQLHISARHLNNIISERSGKSISVMIQERLLIEAKRLLLHSEQTVNEIAYELGFNDKAYFYRFFKKYTNSTPNNFRKRNSQ